jgi:pimeloyl-ACP methyl ester carboxylesterase
MNAGSGNHCAGQYRVWIGALVCALIGAVGCNLGGRHVPAVDSGIDGGDTDSDSDSDSDTGSETGEDDDWRYQDAGSAWDDGSVSIDGPCDNDCFYLYEITGGDWFGAGQSFFEISPAGAGKVEARGLDAYRYILWVSSNWSNWAIYRQRLLATYTLDSMSHDLISGEATVYNRFGGVERLRQYTFEYNQWYDELTVTIESDGRQWTQVVSTPTAPLLMFNLRDFPLQGHGNHSSLFAYLIGERYDWDTGGDQQLPVYSPEQERLDVLTVGEGDDPDTLLVRVPVDLALPSDEDLPGYDPNNCMYEYDQGVPVRFETREPYYFEVVSGTPLELNIAQVPESTTVVGPTPLGGYSSSQLQVVSGSLTLEGTVDDPDAAGPHPAVVLLPGWDRMTRLGEVGAVDLYGQLADRLAAAGYLVARTDARGSGASEGALEHATVAELVADAEATVAAVAALGEADGTEVILLASGLGAHVAAQVAVGGNVDVAGVILLAPIGSDFEDSADNLYEYYLGNAGFHEDYIEDVGGDLGYLMVHLGDGSYDDEFFLGHDVPAWQSLLGTDLVDDPVALPPTLIMIGTEDHLVPLEEATDLAAALEGASVEVTTEQLDGLTHAFTVGTADDLWPEHSSVEVVDDAAVTALVTWLDAHTGGE